MSSTDLWMLICWQLSNQSFWSLMECYICQQPVWNFSLASSSSGRCFLLIELIKLSSFFAVSFKGSAFRRIFLVSKIALMERLSSSSWLIRSQSILGLIISNIIFSWSFNSSYAHQSCLSTVCTWVLQSTGCFWSRLSIAYIVSRTLSLFKNLASFCSFERSCGSSASTYFKSLMWLFNRGCIPNSHFSSFYPSVSLSFVQSKNHPQSFLLN